MSGRTQAPVLSKKNGWYYRWLSLACLLVVMFSTAGTGWAGKMTVVEALESRTDVMLYTRALKRTGVWQSIVNAEYVTLFVPTDQALENEGSDVLLDVVLRTPENSARLQNVVVQHVYHGQRAQFSSAEVRFLFRNQDGGCIIVEQLGRQAVKVGPEAVVVGHDLYSNGELVIIDRLLWQPYIQPIGC